NALERFANFFGVLTGKNPAIDVGASGLRESVWGMSAGKQSGNARGVQERIVIRDLREPSHGGGIRRLLGDGFHVRGELAVLHRSVPFERAAGDFMYFQG